MSRLWRAAHPSASETTCTADNGPLYGCSSFAHVLCVVSAVVDIMCVVVDLPWNVHNVGVP